MPSAEELITQFKRYCVSHPNLANCWIAYLGLKKRHWHENDIAEQDLAEQDLADQALFVLNSFEQGNPDLNKNTIISLLLYYQVMI